MKVVVDPSVLGGVVARIGDIVIDGSVRHRLEQLKENSIVSMAELTINADEIAAALRKHVEHVHALARRRRRSAACSRSVTASRASPGLPDTAVNELLEFEGGTLGLALNLDEDSIGAVVLGEAEPDRRGPARSRPPGASSRSPSATR